MASALETVNLVFLGLLTLAVLAYTGILIWQAFAQPSNACASSKRASSFPVVWSGLGKEAPAEDPVNPGECAMRCGAACMGRPDVHLSEHCARMCANACGLSFS